MHASGYIAQLYTHASSHTIHTQSSMSTTMSLVYLWPRKASFEQRVTIMAIPNRTRKIPATIATAQLMIAIFSAGDRSVCVWCVCGVGVVLVSQMLNLLFIK